MSEKLIKKSPEKLSIIENKKIIEKLNKLFTPKQNSDKITTLQKDNILFEGDG